MSITRRSIFIAVTAFLVKLSPVLAQDTAILRGTNIRLRDEPAVKGKVLAILQGGMSVTLTGNDYVDSGWRYVQATTMEGVTGWIRWEFVIGAHPDSNSTGESAYRPTETLMPATGSEEDAPVAP